MKDSHHFARVVVLKRRESTGHQSLPICRQICRDVGVDLFPMNWRRDAHDPLLFPIIGSKASGEAEHEGFAPLRTSGFETLEHPTALCRYFGGYAEMSAWTCSNEWRSAGSSVYQRTAVLGCVESGDWRAANWARRTVPANQGRSFCSILNRQSEHSVAI
jgi:hypothetical protein